jgi:hypothetical protein
VSALPVALLLLKYLFGSLCNYPSQFDVQQFGTSTSAGGAGALVRLALARSPHAPSRRLFITAGRRRVIMWKYRNSYKLK